MFALTNWFLPFSSTIFRFPYRLFHGLSEAFPYCGRDLRCPFEGLRFLSCKDALVLLVGALLVVLVLQGRRAGVSLRAFFLSKEKNVKKTFSTDLRNFFNIQDGFWNWGSRGIFTLKMVLLAKFSSFFLVKNILGVIQPLVIPEFT